VSLSVAIITLNEEANLARTLESVRWAQEIIIVDSGSTDRTVEIAESFGAKVFSQDWLGFGAQKNVALSKCTCDWILSIDADEELSPELQREIQAIVNSTVIPTEVEEPAVGSPGAYTIPRRNFFLGRWLRHGGMYPDAKPRLIRRSLFESGKARFAERLVHEDIVTDVPTTQLRGDTLHHAYPTIENYIEHQRHYAALAGEMIHLKEKARSKPHPALWFAMQTLLNPYLTFIYNYFLRGGFLDGRPGLIYHAYHSCYISWKYAKAWQLNKSS
jgi:glycosyltransferase involved in cell wall biosynthesis